MLHKPVAAMLATLAAVFVSPAIAADVSTHLVECGSASCLVITGHRDNAATAVRINGHAVSVEGNRRWQARVPVEVVRGWSVPFARTIEVTLLNGQAQAMSSTQADLPIGLMGHADLASLVIRAH